MAGGAVIGALRVVLGADTAALDKGLKDSQSNLAAFGASVATGVAAAAAAVAAAAVAIGIAMQRTIDDMDKLSKSSAKLGIPVEQLSALAYAADLSDVSFESLSKGVAKLSKNMVEAAAKPTSEAANAFKALGVSVKDSDGKLKSSQEVMGEVADKFAGLKDGAGKTAVSIALFGRAGADLIPMLNDGKDGLKSMSDEAQQWGIIFDAKTGKAAEAFNDNLTRLGYAWKGIIVQSVSQVLPTLVEVSNQLVETAKNSGILQVGINVVSTAMKGLVSAGVIVGAVFKTLAEYVATVSTSLSLLLQGQFAKAWSTIQAGVSGVGETAIATFGTIDKLWKGQQAGAEAGTAATDQATKAQKEFNFAALGGKNAVDQFIDSQNKSLVSRQAEIATFGLLAGQKEAMTLQLQAETIAKQNNMAITAQQQLQLDALKQKTADYALTLAGLQMTQANLSPAQLFQQEQAKIQALFDAGKISAETYGNAMQRVAEQANATWAQAGESMAGSFAQIAGSFSKESKGMAMAAKIFGAIQATISMFTGGAKALELPFPANLAAMAAVLAKGASLVASIKGQSVPNGFKDGLSMTVPGGVGGGDTRLFQARVEPGEQIDITPNRGGNAGQNNRNSAPSIFNISVGAASAHEFLRKLIDDLNGMTSDGYRLNVVPA
jgi:hypothetical protein